MLARELEVGGDAARAVGVHDDDAPRALLDGPRDASAALRRSRRRPRTAGCPARRAAGAPGARRVKRGLERVDVEVAHLRVGHAGEVAVDVPRGRDADEQRAAGGARRLDADAGELAGVDRVRDADDLGALVRDRVRAGREAVGGGREVAVVVALRLVGPEQRAAGGDERQGDQARARCRGRSGRCCPRTSAVPGVAWTCSGLLGWLSPTVPVPGPPRGAGTGGLAVRVAPRSRPGLK